MEGKIKRHSLYLKNEYYFTVYASPLDPFYQLISNFINWMYHLFWIKSFQKKLFFLLLVSFFCCWC